MPLILALLALPALSLAAALDSIENKVHDIPAPPPKKTRPTPCPRLDLHKAVAHGKPACVEAAARSMDVNDRDTEGATPLHNAVQVGNAGAVRALVRAGADLHLRDFQGLRPQELAERLGQHAISDYLRLLERENERLHEAAEYNDIVAVSNSLRRGASLGMRDVRLDTLLHRAAQNGFVDLGRLLVHHGARLEARNYLGETPLHQAALRDDLAFMELLIREGANVNAINERRQTPWDIASIHADSRILLLLRKSGARPGRAASVEHDFVGSGP